jgi:hypothetical protein
LTSASRGVGLFVAHAWATRTRRQTDMAYQPVAAAGD